MVQDCLSGVKILDLSQYLPGPFATMLLADMGGTVVKVEPPGGDPMAQFAPRGSDGVSPFYTAVNGGKTIVRLDLKDPAGQEALAALVARADVLMESFRPGVLDRLGFGPDRLRALNPGLVHCALSGFGQDGPWRLRAGHDITYMALAGVLALNGPADHPPHMPYPPLADHVSALTAVTAILGALVRKGRTGQGARLDVSIFESALHINYMALAVQGLDSSLGRMRECDLLDGGAACYRTYRCADGRFLAVGAIEPKFWAAFCAAVGRPEWTDRQAESLPQTALSAEVAAHLEGRPLAEWVAVLEAVDCCVEPVLTPTEALTQPHVVARGLADDRMPFGGLRLPVVSDGHAPIPRPGPHFASADFVLTSWDA